MARIDKSTHSIKRGDLWTTDLRPGQGFEVSKKEDKNNTTAKYDSATRDA